LQEKAIRRAHEKPETLEYKSKIHRDILDCNKIEKCLHLDKENKSCQIDLPVLKLKMKNESSTKYIPGQISCFDFG
jgi:hypothetical protein